MRVRFQFIALMVLGVFVTVVVAKKAVLNASNVTIVSINTSHLVVSRTVKGKTEQLQFVLSPDTVRSGKLDVGTRVSVHYMTQNHENLATSVQTLDRSPTSAKK